MIMKLYDDVASNVGVSNLLEAKDTTIQVPNKKLKMTHNSFPQTLELLIELHEKEDLEKEFHRAKGTIGVLQNQIDELNQEVQTLSKS